MRRPTNAKTVVIVGAGPSGLVTAKEMIQEGHRVVCFERNAQLGGVFRFQPAAEAVSVWESCRLTSSILVTSFSDYFPRWREAQPFDHGHMTAGEYCRYLEGYAEHFGVRPCIRFECEVVDVSLTVAGGWRVTTRTPGREEHEVVECDVVAICSGVHHRPYLPDIPGLDAFEGQVLHAANYKGPSSVRGRRTLFIGGGESSEIVAEMAPRLERAYVSLRRGVFVLPRILNGYPNDYTGTRLLYSLPAFVSRRSDPVAQKQRRQLAAALFPLWVLRGGLVAAEQKWRARQAIPQDPRMAEIESLILDLRAKAGGTQFETFATKTEGFLGAVVDGRCGLRPAVKAVHPWEATFVDGTTVSIDSIVLCTGFAPPTVRFLNVPVDPTHLYKRCFHPTYREKLGFIGFVRPPLGAIPPMAEMQARWYAQLVSGALQLPTPAQMEVAIAQEAEHRRVYHRQVAERLPYLVDFSTYMDDLADLIGCKPRFADFLSKPELLYKLHAAALCGAQYRFRGPHAQPDLAAKVIAATYAHAPVYRFLDVGLAELARALGLEEYQPHLSLLGQIRRSPKQTGVPD